MLNVTAAAPARSKDGLHARRKEHSAARDAGTGQSCASWCVVQSVPRALALSRLQAPPRHARLRCGQTIMAQVARRHRAGGLGCLMFACAHSTYRCRAAQACSEHSVCTVHRRTHHTGSQPSAPSHLELSNGVLSVPVRLRNRLDLPCRAQNFPRLRRGRSGRGGQTSFISIARHDLRIMHSPL